MRRLRAGFDTRAFGLPLGTLPIAAKALATKPLAVALTAFVAVVGMLYWPATTGPFQFDDYNVIVDNPAIHSLPAWFDSMPGIRPLLKLSYTLNWSLLNGALSPQPFGFHLFNIGCHLLSTALVFTLLNRLRADHRHGGLIALAGAALFALHPAQTEAITYICGRSVALMSLFYLAALVMWLTPGALFRWCCFMRTADQGNSVDTAVRTAADGMGARRIVRYGGAAIVAAMGNTGFRHAATDRDCRLSQPARA